MGKVFIPQVFLPVFCFSNKIRAFDLVGQRFLQKKEKAASLLNQNRFGHLSFSQNADDYED